MYNYTISFAHPDAGARTDAVEAGAASQALPKRTCEVSGGEPPRGSWGSFTPSVSS